MSREELDRERIMEWLQSVPSAADPHYPSESDRGLMFDPDTTQAISQPQKQQQQQQHHQQRLQHRITYPLMQRQRRMPAPVVFTSLTKQNAARALSMGSLPMCISKLSGRADASIAQSCDHLSGLYRRQKSESPLPGVPNDPELPIFTPSSPALPGRRTPKQMPGSDRSVAGLNPPSALRHSRSGPGTVSKPSWPTHCAKPTSSSLPLGQTRKFPVADSTASLQNVTSVDWGELEEQSGSQEPRDREEGTDSPLPPAVCSTGSVELQSPPLPSQTHDCDRPSNQHSLDSSVQLASAITGVSDKMSTLEPTLEQVGEYVVPPTEDTVLQTNLSSATLENEGEGQKCAPLLPVELATLSLQVVDILPQLAVYLSMGYSEYERIIYDESSPQKQSMAVLMKWYRSGAGRGRRELAEALQQCGDKYNSIAQLLLKGELGESRHTVHDLEEGVSPPKSLSHTPAPLSHHHHSPPPFSHLPPPPTSQLSPEHKLHTTPPSHSSPLLPLSAQTRKLKQGFTFDEGRRSSDSLPKFLSNRPLHTSSDSSHHQSPLLPHSYTLHSQPLQHQTSLSDASTNSASSLPADPASSHVPYTSKQKASFQSDEVLTQSGSRQDSGYYCSTRRKSSLQSDELLRVVGSGYQCADAIKESPDREEPVKQVGSEPGVCGVGLELLNLADSHQAGSPAQHKTQQSFTVELQAPSKETAQLRANLASLYQPSTSRPFPTPFPPFLSHESSVGKERRELVKTKTVTAQETPPYLSRGDSGIRRKVKRQDSGFETLVSQFSTTP